MLLTRSIIEINIDSNQWLNELNTLLNEIESNVEIEPDISIESCKSLLESIGKNILMRLDNTYSEQKVKKLDVHVLLKNANDKLSEINISGEYELTSRFISVLHHIAEIRNKRGEVSHGKTLPKGERSSVNCANAIKSFTDGFASYLLSLFLSIDFSYKESVRYEDKVDFNNSLDEAFPLDAISYSKALYDQDYDAYVDALENYQNDLEQS